MITLDVNLQYLTDHYNIGAQQLKAYQGKSIKEIMQIEAKKGNKKAADFSFNITTNPLELIEIFRLMNPENRYEIINNMNFGDKLKLLQKLDKGEMLLGLKFFQKEKLLKMMTQLDKEDIAVIALQKYNLEDYIKAIPEKYMNKFFDSQKVKPEQIMKGLMHMNPDQLAKILENVTGETQKDKSKEEMLLSLGTMNPNMLKTAVKSLEQEEKGYLMYEMIKEEPELINEIEEEGLVAPMEELEKDDLVMSLIVMDKENFMDMLSQLPEDLMAVTASQINPEIFAQILSKDFSEIINQIKAA